MGSTMIPSMRYKDAPRMLEWLCRAFGFERHLVVPGEHGTIAHAELTLGDGMIMLGSHRDDEIAKLWKPAADASVLTGSVYVVVEDCDAHHARAKAAGAELVFPLEAKEYGGKGYGARDPEGQLWYFGSFDPWPKK